MQKNKLNRTIAPKKHQISAPNYLEPTQKKFQDSPVYLFKKTDEELVHISITIPRGFYHVEDTLPLSLAQSLLFSGTEKYPNHEITNKIDFFGAYPDWHVDYHFSTFTIICLNRVLIDVLPLINEVIFNSIFTQKNLDKELEKRKQDFEINNQKVQYVARQHFSNQLFGDGHVYGRIRSKEEYNNVSLDSVKEAYSTFLKEAEQRFFISGNISDEQLIAIKENLLNNSIKPFNKAEHKDKKEVNSTVKFHKEVSNTVQTAINIGFKTVHHSHQDFLNYKVINTILGGYFGSRLMSNIREEKGYTYGIGSYIKSFNDSSYFAIQTQVGNEFKEDTIKQIEFEINRLKTEPISTEELNLVQNYILGQILSSSDGISNQVSNYQNLKQMGYSWDRSKELIDTVKNITPEIILEKSKEFFKELTIVTAG